MSDPPALRRRGLQWLHARGSALLCACAALAPPVQAQNSLPRTVHSEAYFARALRPARPADPAAIDSQVEALLRRMTLEEKVGQMTQVDLSVLGSGAGEAFRLDSLKLHGALHRYGIGSVLNAPAGVALTPERWRELLAQIGREARRTRLAIPVIYGIDAVHGANYTLGAQLFPQNLGMAATWNPELAERAATVTAREVRASGIAWDFAPVLDVGRQPLWPRLYETFGEDTYLATVMGVATVRGLEGRDVGDPTRVAATLKHFLGYSAPRTGRDRTPTEVDERTLREYFLPTFAAAVRAGAHAVMVNSGSVGGIPVHADRHWLTEVLRGELGFRGLVVSDWADIERLVSMHHVAADAREATRMAVLAGVDMSMVPLDFSFPVLLAELVRAGEVPEARVDEAVRRVLRLKWELGLFAEAPAVPTLVGDSARSLALEAAREGLVLLRNRGDLLPLSKTARVLVTGPTANTLRSLNNGWSYTWQGDAPVGAPYPGEQPTILEAIRRMLPAANVVYLPGTSYDRELDPAAVAQAAAHADVVVVCLGEESYAETLGNLEDLALPWPQRHLLQMVQATGKPVVLVLAEGRPRLLDSIDRVAGVLAALNPGSEGGQAIAEVLFGDANPSGRLPITYPRFPHDLTVYDQGFAEQWGDRPSPGPLFGFGAGLSYTRFAYENLRLAAREVEWGGSVELSVTVRNVGALAGKEVVQLYLSDLVASVAPPVRRLKRFAKVELAPGEARTLCFTLRPEDLSFVSRDGEPVVEPGDFVVAVGGLSERFTLRAPALAR